MKLTLTKLLIGLALVFIAYYGARAETATKTSRLRPAPVAEKQARLGFDYPSTRVAVAAALGVLPPVILFDETAATPTATTKQEPAALDIPLQLRGWPHEWVV